MRCPNCNEELEYLDVDRIAYQRAMVYVSDGEIMVRVLDEYNEKLEHFRCPMCGYELSGDELDEWLREVR